MTQVMGSGDEYAALLGPTTDPVVPRDWGQAEGARLLLALTNSDTKKALASGAVARKGLSTVSEAHQRRVERLWDAAGEEALHHLLLVLSNNPHKSKAEILRRPDVQSALRQPFEQAAIESEKIVRLAWEDAATETVKKAKGEFKLLKLDWPGDDYDLSEDFLESIVGDLHANAKAMRQRYQQALLGEKGTLEGVTRDARTRASFSVSTAVWGVASLIRDSIAALAGINRMWVARMDAATCSVCKSLHKVVVGPGEAFPIHAGLKVYGGVLFGPPRHPRCRCISVFTKMKKTKLKS